MGELTARHGVLPSGTHIFPRRLARDRYAIGRRPSLQMREYTTREKLKITAGAVASLVIVGWVFVLAIAFLSVR